MFFRLLNHNQVGTFLLLLAVGAFAFWGLMVMIAPATGTTPAAWMIPVTLLLVAVAHLTARPLVRGILGLDRLG